MFVIRLLSAFIFSGKTQSKRRRIMQTKKRLQKVRHWTIEKHDQSDHIVIFCRFVFISLAKYNKRNVLFRILERNSQLCRGIADHGMEVSKVIVEEQDRQRQKLLRVVRGKVSKDVEVRKTWRNLIHHVTQER